MKIISTDKKFTINWPSSQFRKSDNFSIHGLSEWHGVFPFCPSVVRVWVCLAGDEMGINRVAQWKIEYLSPPWSRGRIPDRPIPYLIERVTLFDSLGFLWGLWFPPTLHYKSLNIVFLANNVFKNYFKNIPFLRFPG
jgi:hypothetical protein